VKFKVSIWMWAELKAIFIFHYSSGKFWDYCLQLGKRQISFFWRGGWIGQCSATYRMHVALRCGCSGPTTEWLDSSAVDAAHTHL